VAACVALSCLAISAMAQGPPDQSKFVVAMSVKNGKVETNGTSQKTLFTPTPAFNSRLRKSLSQSRVQEILMGDIDKALDRLPKLYWYALTENERTQDAKGALSDQAATSALGSFTGEWPAFAQAFNAWAAAGNNRLPLFQVFAGAGILKGLNDIDSTSAVIFSSTGRPSWDVANGTVTFRVADPIGNLADSSQYTVAVGGSGNRNTVATSADMIRQLEPVEGMLWRSADIKPRIEEFYTSRGLQPAIKISPAKAHPKSIQIAESPRIARIILMDSVPADSVDKALYLLLSDTEFRLFLKTNPLTANPGTGGQPAYKVLDYQILCKPPSPEAPSTANASVAGPASSTTATTATRPRTVTPPCSEPYLDTFRLQIQALQLQQVGLTVVPQTNFTRPPSANTSYVDLIVNKAAASTSASGKPSDSTTKPATPLANEEGVIDPNIQTQAGRNGFVATTPALKSGQAGADSDAGQGTTSSSSKSGDKKNYVGGGLEYKPGQGVQVFSLYQRSELGLLSKQDSFSVKAGGQGKPLGDVNYFADFVLFNTLHRRLSVQFTGSSDFTASRLFGGVKTDERRTGGLAKVELELFRDLNGSMLRVNLEGKRTTVELTQNGQTAGKQNLTDLDLGALYMFQSSAARYAKRLKIQPRLRFGLKLSPGEPNYRVFSLTGNYHQQLPGLFETDLSANVGVANAGTPIFEQPSLGGAECLRGFRKDDAIGRRLWSLQNELWAPIPSIGDSQSSLNKFLRRQVRLAGFVDVGGLDEATASKSGIRTGPGLGARIIFFPVVMKLDWAYGLGDAAVGRGHGRVYFSVSTNAPF
jgi:hypothetical protein